MLNIVPGIDLLHLIGQIAGDGLHHVAEGHNPLDGTKLIDHKGKMGAGLAELIERREERQPLREDQRLTHQRLQIQRLLAQGLLEQVNNMHHPQQIFIILPAGDHQPGMLIFLHQAADLFLRRAEVDALDIMARRHNTADAALIKVQHPLNHQSFLRIKQWMLILIGDQRRRVSIQFSFFFLPAQQIHHRFGSALTQRHIGGEEATAVKLRQLVKRFNHDREANGRI